MKKLFFVILFSVLITGCATQTFNVNGGGSELPDAEVMQSFYINGIGQQKQMDAAELCGGAEKIARVETHHEFLDVVLGAVTFGIYTPRTARVYCLS